MAYRPDRPPSFSGRGEVLLVFADPVLQPLAQPYGVTIVRDAVRTRGVDAEVILPFLRPRPLEYFEARLHELRPVIVGLSFRNLDTAGFRYDSDGEETYLESVKPLVASARSCGSLVAVGGSGFSIAPERVLEEIGADVGFVGTSEAEFAEFCWRVLRGQADLVTACRELRSAIFVGKQAPGPVALPILGAVTLNREAVEYARLTGATIPVRTKTGCSLRCTYCVVPWIEVPLYRSWPAIRAELRSIVEEGLGDGVFIADGEFNLPSVDRAIDVCRCIEREFCGSVRWRCYLSEKQVTRELVEAMARAGCVAASVSVDALTQETRRGFAKGSSVEVAMDAVRLCLLGGLRTNVNMLFGGPNETWATLELGAHRAALLRAEGALLSVTIGLRVYPGTPLSKQARLPRYVPWFRECRQVPWLGVFCSPATSEEVAAEVLPILPPSPSITYTGGVSGSESGLDLELARGAVALAERRLEESRRIFLDLKVRYPSRLEPDLGLLKVHYYSLVNERSDDGIGCVEAARAETMKQGKHPELPVSDRL